MGWLADFLFGKKRIILDSKLGEISARVRNHNNESEITWKATLSIVKQPEDTLFILEGDTNGPFKGQLDAAHSIIENYHELLATASKKKAITSRGASENYELDGFYFACLTTLEYKKNTFEICFDPTDEEIDYAYSLKWEYGKITQINKY